MKCPKDGGECPLTPSDIASALGSRNAGKKRRLTEKQRNDKRELMKIARAKKGMKK